jgi:hypothetical protein
MNRKLQHTMTALSATAAVLGLMLLAGAPPQPVQPDFGVFAASASLDAVAPDAGWAAAAGAEADAAAAPRAGHARRARSALALPYFSIAQGLRRATGS